MSPGAADVSWRDDGWAVARGVLDRSTVVALLAHLDHLMAARADGGASGLVAGVVVDDPVWLAAVADPRLVDLAEALLRADQRPGDTHRATTSPGVVLFSSCWVVKPPRTGRRAAWHQDGSTWPLAPLDAVTLWVALDDADAGNGGLRVVPGSHRCGLLPHQRDDRRLATELFNVAVAPASVDEAAAVDVELRAGDVSAHHPALLHSSRPNRSDRPRRALVARYHPSTTVVTQPGWPSTVILRPPTLRPPAVR